MQIGDIVLVAARVVEIDAATVTVLLPAEELPTYPRWKIPLPRDMVKEEIPKGVEEPPE